MMFHNLFGGPAAARTPEQFLTPLDTETPTFAWRAARLAQTPFPHDSLALRANPDFALELVERLRKPSRPWISKSTRAGRQTGLRPEQHHQVPRLIRSRIHQLPDCRLPPSA